jgi:penicillin-binding protein 1A
MTKFQKIVIGFLIFTITLMIAIGGYIFYLYEDTKFASEKIIYYNPPLSARFYDRNHNLLAIRYKNENRLYVKYKDIPGRVIETLIATEDTSFFEHPGININAIIRALIKDIKAGKKVEGASTITQQLVRNIYLSRKKTLSRKIKEIFLSLKIERILTKEEILERYLNQIYFGHRYYGIKTAALGYFHKDLKDLSLKEIAMLIALPKGPSIYDPTRHYEANTKRANSIIKRMYNLGWITKAELKKALSENPKVYDYFVKQKAPYAVDTAIRKLLPKYPDLLTRGYNITLTIDLPTQEIAQKTLKWNYQRLIKEKPELNNSTLNGALININQKTGEVLALVGGVDYKKSKFNRVIQSRRSVGSSIKPFIYQIALNYGYNPASKIADISRVFKIKTPQEDEVWKPKNYERNTLGLITLREALVHSRNLATINLVRDLGLDVVINNLEKFGFPKMPYNLSISLGSIGIDMWRFSELYTIISNYGEKSKLRIIKEINIPFENKKIIPKEIHQNIEPAYQAYLMINMMEDVVKKGTGRKAFMPQIQVAGKTGTTNDYKDAWFVGFTPNSQTIIWFGKDNAKSLGKGMSGGRVSAPAFKYFYEHLLKVHPELLRKFIIPQGVKTYTINGKKELYTPLSPPATEQKEGEIPIF